MNFKVTNDNIKLVEDVIKMNTFNDNKELILESERNNELFSRIASNYNAFNKNSQNILDIITMYSRGIEALKTNKNIFKSEAVNKNIEYYSYIDNEQIARIEKLFGTLNNNIQKLYDRTNILYTKFYEKSTLEQDYKNSVKINIFNQDINQMLLNIDCGNVEKIPKLEENSFKKGIYDKFLLIQTKIDLKNIEKTYEQLEKMGFFKKFLAKITGRTKIINEEKEHLQDAKNKISDRQKRLSLISKPQYKYSIHKILADIYIYIEDIKDIAEFQEELNEIEDIKRYIIENYKIDSDKVEKLIEYKKRNCLPQVIDKKITKLDKMRQQYNDFLVLHGYIKNDDYQKLPSINEKNLYENLSKNFDKINDIIDMALDFIEKQNLNIKKYEEKIKIREVV